MDMDQTGSGGGSAVMDIGRSRCRRAYRSHRLLLSEIRRRQAVRRWDDESFFSMARRCDRLDEACDRPVRFMAALIGVADLQADDWWTVAETVRLVLDDNHGSEARTQPASAVMMPVTIEGPGGAVDAIQLWSAARPVPHQLCLTA